MTPQDQRTGSPEQDAIAVEPAAPAKKPLYPRLLRLRNIAPNAWQRAALGEGALGVAVLLVLADLASAWTLLALPVAVAVVVKAHDVVAGLLRRPDDALLIGPEELSPQLGLEAKDLAVLAALTDAGADLSQPRQALYYLYAPDEPAATAVGEAAAARGFTPDLRPPDDEDPRWLVVCETTAVLDPATVRRNTELFEQLAQTTGAEYDGWEAAV